MSEHYFNFQDANGRKRKLSHEHLVAFLRTPKGMEMLADAVRAARGPVSDDIEPSQLGAMRDFENGLRAASARPLQPELAL